MDIVFNPVVTATLQLVTDENETAPTLEKDTPQ